MERRLLAIVAAASAALGLAGCTSVRVSATRPSQHYPDAHAVYSVRHESTVALRAGTFRYLYYPRVQVYFAPDRACYYWLEGGTWRTGKKLPPGLAFRANEGVDITLDCEEPYLRHDRVRANYDGDRDTGSRHDDRQDQGPPGRGHDDGGSSDGGNASGMDTGKGHDNGKGKGHEKGKGKGHEKDGDHDD